MQGLKTKEGPAFCRFFEVVRRQAAQLGCVFFADAGEGRDIKLGDMEDEDLSGWRIPHEHAEAFQDEWDPLRPSEQWLTFFRFAIWRVENDRIRIGLKEYS